MQGAIENRIKEAVARLMATRGSPDSIRVSVPVLYPSGSSSTVEIGSIGETCFVSDMGFGHTEAFLANAGDFYDRQARDAAERFGIGYDGQSIFLVHAPIDRIEGAIAAVSNASVQAASLAVLKASEDKERKRNDQVYDRVRSIFGADAVTKSAEIEGRHAVWTAHNVVSLPRGRRAIFEFVTAHQNSVSNKFMMFSDIASRHQELALNSVVRSVANLGAKATMLQDVSNVIQLDASNDDFLRYAKAA